MEFSLNVKKIDTYPNRTIYDSLNINVSGEKDFNMTTNDKNNCNQLNSLIKFFETNCGTECKLNLKVSDYILIRQNGYGCLQFSSSFQFPKNIKLNYEK